MDIEKIVAEGKKLAEKRTWVEKDFSDVLGKINQELALIPSMDEPPISFCYREYEENSYKRTVRAQVSFQTGSRLEIILEKERYGGWVEENITKSPTVENIRALTKRLPEVFSCFLEEIEKRNTENQKAIGIMADLAAEVVKGRRHG